MGLPTGLYLLALLGVLPAQAQQSFQVRLNENFRRDSSTTAPILATVRANAQLAGHDVGGRWIRVTLEGWVWAASLETTSQDGFGLRVRASGGENLRRAPNEQVIAQLREGCLLTELERRTDWVRVRREGWMWGQSLAGAAAAPEQPPEPAVEPEVEVVEAGLDWAVVADRAALRQRPDGDTTAVLGADASVRIVARSGDWVRVQTEGWLREDQLRAGSPGVLVGVSGAEVRSRPAAFANKVVQWTVQLIAVQRADEVRYDIPAGQRYLLVRGPVPETGFVYVTITDDHVAQFEQMEPLTELVIVGRIRTGRSRYLGNPVLQLVDFALRGQ